MPGQFFKDIFTSDASELIRLYRSVYGQAQSSKSIQDIIAFSKALAECALPEGYILTDAIKDIENNVKSFSDLQYLWNRVLKKHPEYMVCIPLMMAGLTEFIKEHIKEIYDEIKLFYKGAIALLPNIVKGIVQALSGTTLKDVTKNILNQLIDGAMTMGMGYLLYWENKAVDAIEEKAMNTLAKVGKMIALYMTLFTEFRWAMILVFIKNTKNQIDDRIKKINEVRKALQALQYEQFILGDRNVTDQREAYLALYEAALLKLENTIPLVNSIERRLYKKSSYDKFLSDRVRVNLNDAEDLLLKQRNTFIEHFFYGKMSDTADSDSSWKFYLSNDYTNNTLVQNAPPSPIFWSGDPEGSGISLKKVYCGVNVNNNNNLEVGPVPTNLKLPSTGIWIEQKTNFNTAINDILYIQNNFFSVKEIETVKVPSFDSVTKVNTSYEGKFLKIEGLETDSIIDFPKLKTAEIYKEMGSSCFGLTFEWKKFEFDNNGGYKITTLNEDENKIAPPYSIDIKKDGITFIKNMWGESKNYSLYLFFNVKGINKSFKMLGIYPNMVEKESERREVAAQELPEPFKSMYNAYSDLKDKHINKLTGDDILDVGSKVSTFLFGKDILKDNIYKFKREVFSYDRYLETASNLLEQMCPLKNSYLYFYTLLNTLKNLDTDLDITNTIVLRDWIALNNRIILDTLTSMTYRIPGTNEFATLEAIRKSPFLVALVPSVLLDIDNIEMMKMFLSMDNEMGTGLNKNRELQKMYFKLMNFIKWLRDKKVIERLQETEDLVWSNIYNSILSTIHLMLAGEAVSGVRRIMKKNMKILYMLSMRLNQISQTLGYFLSEGNRYTSIINDPSMKDFQRFLERNGLGHFYEYIKNGQWSNFINENINEWVGKYSGLINCLLKYKEKFKLGGADKMYLDKIINFLTKWQRGDILTQYEINVTGTFKSLNLNFIGKVPIGLKTSLSKNLKLVEAANTVKKQITKNLLTIN